MFHLCLYNYGHIKNGINIILKNKQTNPLTYYISTKENTNQAWVLPSNMYLKFVIVTSCGISSLDDDSKIVQKKVNNLNNMQK